MERVVFLTEPNERSIPCLLNPETVVIRRSAGFKARSSFNGTFIGTQQTEHPLLFSGGGITLIELELLFDVTLPEASPVVSNVRQLTSEFFRMTESVSQTSITSSLPAVRMIWGKSWNILAVVTDVSERLDYFTYNGIPQRSWLKIRLRKINSNDLEDHMGYPKVKSILSGEDLDKIVNNISQSYMEERIQEFDNTEIIATTERLDHLAEQYYGNPSLWKLLAVYNGIMNPLEDNGLRNIKIPPLSNLKQM